MEFGIISNAICDYEMQGWKILTISPFSVPIPAMYGLSADLKSIQEFKANSCKKQCWSKRNSKWGTRPTSYLEWYWVQQYGTYGKKGTEGFFRIRLYIRFMYLEGYMKTSIQCSELANRNWEMKPM